jgi:folate-binding protein YgfZ
MTPLYCLLPEIACIEARGADATAFLHTQLSQSLETLESNRAPLAAWHDARGRVRALFRVVRLADRWLLFTASDALESTLKRLRMFVLRSAVTLDAAPDWRAAALIGVTDSWLRERGLVDTQDAALVTRGELLWLRVGPGYWQVFGPAASIDHLEPSLERVPAPAATLAEIQLGIPTVGADLVEQFVPQMLNLDELGALSFTKGCYPGQEVIARVHNLGSVKRRVRRYAIALSALPTGGEITTAAGQAVGKIVRATPTATGFEFLAVVEHTAAEAALFIGGAPLHELPLPYAVPHR